MCSYNKDYLKESSPGTGSKKLLHWSSKDVSDWVRRIELDEYVTGLEEAGIHGALMVRFPTLVLANKPTRKSVMI